MIPGKTMNNSLDALKERGYKSIHFLVNKHNVKAIIFCLEGIFYNAKLAIANER